MTCEDARKALPLFLYGELSFDDEERVEAHLENCGTCRGEFAQQKGLHRALDAMELEPPPDLLFKSREELRRRVGAAGPPRESFWERLKHGFTIHVHPIPAGLQPIGAAALIAMGFFGARMLPTSTGERTFNSAGLMAPVTSRVRYVEPASSGKVQIVVEETRQRMMSGSVDDQNIQKLLLAAARDPQDPGLRVESVGLLQSRPESAEVRNALLYALQHDTNPGVRLKALDGLKSSAADTQVRQVLTQVLLHDENPGVRTQAIDLLIQHKEDRMVGVLQELMRKEDNGYVRLRCEKALHEMNASVETY